MEYHELVSRGRVPLSYAVHLSGYNGEIDTATVPEDVWTGGGLYPFQAAAVSLEVLSSSASDTSAGTGARTVRLTGLNASWVLQTVDVTLNGVSVVSVPTLTWLRLNSAVVLTTGSGGTNAGIITVRIASAGATQGLIQVGDGQTSRCIYTVPAGYTALLYDLTVSMRRSDTGRTSEFELLSRDGAAASAPWLSRLILPVSNNASSTVVWQPTVPLAFTEKTDIRLVVTYVSTNDTIVSGAMLFSLIANSRTL